MKHRMKNNKWTGKAYRESSAVSYPLWYSPAHRTKQKRHGQCARGVKHQFNVYERTITASAWSSPRTCGNAVARRSGRFLDRAFCNLLRLLLARQQSRLCANDVSLRWFPIPGKRGLTLGRNQQYHSCVTSEELRQQYATPETQWANSARRAQSDWLMLADAL